MKRTAGLFALALLLAACGKSCRHAPTALDDEPITARAPVLEHPPRVAAARTAFYSPTTFARRPSAEELTALGAQIFRDRGLSASGALACSDCHDPARAFGPPAGGPVAYGGPAGTAPGVRAAPSLRYLQTVPAFAAHATDEDGTDDGPAGGLTWDGRANSLHDQARAPLFSPLEMALTSPADLASRLRMATYADAMRAAFGPTVLDAPEPAVHATLLALEVYQQREAEFYPYSSKLDDVVRGRAQLTPQEQRGRALFEAKAKGNCARCHPDTVSAGFPAFTDFGYVALGVPRNRALATTADPAYFDLGLCGPYRTDRAQHAEDCGAFRTPSLRNVATRQHFMHNGALASLHDAVAFYATRDVTPARWYGPAGVPDDLPARYRGNLEHERPFGARETPVLSEVEIADIVAFLGTLTDRDVKMN